MANVSIIKGARIFSKVQADCRYAVNWASSNWNAKISRNDKRDRERGLY